MTQRDEQGNAGFVLGLIIGAIGGAAAALFLTPKSGEDLRRDVETRISEKAGPMREKAEPLVAQGKERATEFIDKAAERAQDVTGKIAAMDMPFQEDSGQETETGPAPAVGDDRTASSS